MTTSSLAQPASAVLDRRASRALFRFSVFFAAFVLLHIKGGAMVTSTGSGMAFTDWPLARGSLWPPGMDLDDYFEHLHRVSGSLVGLLAIVEAIWIGRSGAPRWLTRLGWALVGLIVVQGILGGVGVLFGQADGRTFWPAAVGHGALAQPTLCVAVLVAFALSDGWRERLPVALGDARGARRLATFALVAVFAQVFVGAAFRHTSLRGLLWLHVAMAVFVSATVVLAASYTSGRFGARSAGFRRLGRFVFALLIVQFLLGFYALAVVRPKDPSNIAYLTRSLLVSAHVIVGAALFLSTTLIVAKSYRNLEPRADAPPALEPPR
ncbi:MAG: COX15/CtaA family protein [Planctomycetes bacterium]|nr:COX15/CtaA family protein [Planctomycetota bacterium]